MNTRKEILESLAETVEPDHVKEQISKRLDEVTLGGITKAAFAATAFTWALSQFKLPKPSRYSKRSSSLDYAKQFVSAKNNKEVAAACVGLMNICGRALLGIPDLKEIGYRLIKLVQDGKFEDFLSDE